LTRIESKAFSYCFALTSITIPRHVQILCSSCFSNCRSLSSISFASDSELARIEAGAFYWTFLSSLIVPKRVSFIGERAFPPDCVVRDRQCRCVIE
jgi:hypothetical protein